MIQLLNIFSIHEQFATISVASSHSLGGLGYEGEKKTAASVFRDKLLQFIGVLQHCCLFVNVYCVLQALFHFVGKQCFFLFSQAVFRILRGPTRDGALLNSPP